MGVALLVKIKNATIQRFLNEKGWSQARLAMELGIGQAKVGDWCNLKDYPRNNEAMFHLCTLVNASTTIYHDVDMLALSEVRHEEALGPSPDDVIEREDCREALMKALTTLTPREEEIIKRRFGIDGEEETLDKIAQDYSLSTERIRQIEAKALRKLQNPKRKGTINYEG